MLPSPQEIHGFIEIARCLNITKAAQSLGVTQPTLSQSLKKLEDNIGEKLVTRSKKGVELTLAGKTFLIHARTLIDYWERAKSQTQSSLIDVKGNIKIGCHPSVGIYTLDKFLPDLMRTYKKLEFTLEHQLSRAICSKVINHELELGLVINPIKHPDLVLIKLLEDEVKIWHRKGKAEEVLICHPELLQTQHILKKLKRRKKGFERTITSNSLEIITTLTREGAGYGVIPSRVVSMFNHKKDLRPLKDSPVFKDELYLIYRVENKNIEYIKTIKESIKSKLKN
jgi:DNA-binding transcriptional LysR family regulator